MRLHKRALEEIREAAAWYRARGEGLDRRFLAAIWEALERVETRSAGLSKLETLPPELPIRRLIVKDFPYLVVFEPFEDEVFVYALAHASRQPNYWRHRKRPKQ